jgi:hypothetical protein
VNDLLTAVDLLPPGISVHRDNFALEDGTPCIRVHVRRDSDRVTTTFTVPIYKKVEYLRVGLFRWKEIEVTDDRRIQDELHEKGQWAVRDLLTART